MLFDHYAEIYLEFKQREVKVSTFDKYQGIVTHRIKPFFYGRLISDIRPSDCKRWLYSITDVSNKSLQLYFGVLKGIFDEALYDEVIDKNPMVHVKMPRHKRPPINPFTADEALSIVDFPENINYRSSASILFMSGIFQGEYLT